ncbi:MAG: hypothetical protein P8184_17070, partial [Calditrichia bacterium]
AAAWAMTISFVVRSAIVAVSFGKLSGITLKEIFAFRVNDFNLVINVLNSVTGKLALFARK